MHGVTLYVDRHGKERARFRLKGMDFPLPHPSDDRFKEAHKMALQGLAPRKERSIPRSIGDLFTRFYSSSQFVRGSDKWKGIVRSTLDQFRTEASDIPARDFNFTHIETMLMRRAKKGEGGKGGPFAAARLHEQLIRLFEFAVKLGWITLNPAKKAEMPVAAVSKGFHSWTDEEIAQFQARHPLGTQARLALEIALWTALRRQDVAKLGPMHIVGGRVRTVAAKTGKMVDVIVADELQAAIDAMPAIGETFLQTQYGKPFSEAGLGNWFRDRCDEADLPECTIHGLRKAFTTRGANAGATQQELKAIGQWAGDSEVATYAAAASQRDLADSVVRRVSKMRTSSNPSPKVRHKSSKRPHKRLTVAGAGGKE